MTWTQLGIVVGVILIVGGALYFQLCAVELNIIRLADLLGEIGGTLKRGDDPGKAIDRIEEQLTNIARDTGRVRRRYAPTDAELADRVRDAPF